MTKLTTYKREDKKGNPIEFVYFIGDGILTIAEKKPCEFDEVVILPKNRYDRYQMFLCTKEGYSRYYLGEGHVYETYLIDVRTGIVHEPTCYPKSEIHKYTNELIDKLTKKYGYEKRFSDVF